MILIVDTNVAILANQIRVEASLERCQEVAIDHLEAITRGEHILVLDDGGEIYEEYLSEKNDEEATLTPFHQKGVGDAFVKWVHDHQWMEIHCQRVPIKRVEDPNSDVRYEELPDVSVRIDPSDRKFIAACCAHGKVDSILEATDSKWWGWKEALEPFGVHIDFLCPEYVRVHYERKFSDR